MTVVALLAELWLLFSLVGRTPSCFYATGSFTAVADSATAWAGKVTSATIRNAIHVADLPRGLHSYSGRDSI